MKKILVADDDRTIVRLVQVNLERAGYEVVTAFDGKDALEKVALENPDLVVLDIIMPLIDGLEVLQNLRKNRTTCSLPVILLSGKAQDAAVFRNWENGVDFFLSKPINPPELMVLVNRIFAAMAEAEERKEHRCYAFPVPEKDHPLLPTDGTSGGNKIH